MTRIKLTQGKYAIIDDNFAHLKNWSWRYHSKGYARTGCRIIKGIQCETFIHHAIVGFPLNGLIVDHINGDGLDNRRENLRFVNYRENLKNSQLRRDGKTSSRYFGVHWCNREKKWIVQAWLNGKRKYIGSFFDEKKAGEAHKLATIEVKKWD